MEWFKSFSLANLGLMVISAFWPISNPDALLTRDRISFYSQSRVVAWLVNGPAGQAAVDNAIILEAYAEAQHKGVATAEDYQLCKKAEDEAILYSLSAVTKYQQAVVKHLGFDLILPHSNYCPAFDAVSNPVPATLPDLPQKLIPQQII